MGSVSQYSLMGIEGIIFLRGVALIRIPSRGVGLVTISLEGGDFGQNFFKRGGIC